MRLTPKPLAGDNDDQRSASRMKRVEDLNLRSQTPGIMTLIRRASIRRTCQSRSGERRVLAGYTVQFTTATTLVAGLAKAREQFLVQPPLAVRPRFSTGSCTTASC